MKIDPGLSRFATPTQQKYIDAIIANGSYRKAAAATGVNKTTIDRSIASLKRKAAQQGYSPEHDQTHVVPDTQYVKGVSTLYDARGNVSAQWVKTSARQEEIVAVLRATAETLADELEGKAKPVKAPETDTARLLAVYPIGDAHIGMYAWGQETGEDHDLTRAIQHNQSATDRLCASAPRCEIAMVVNVGDYFHADNLQNRTQKSGHPLDVDTRLPKVVRVGTDLMRYKIDAALRIHRKVIVRNAMGNHDELLSAMLSLILEAYYRNEPRVQIETSPRYVWYHRFGRNLIGVTHGDRVKVEELGGLMATDAPEDWGLTEHRYWYTGHIHHRRVIEMRGCLAESFRTLAPRDAFNDSHGYRAGRDMYCIVLDRDHGEIERHRVDISMLRRAA